MSDRKQIGRGHPPIDHQFGRGQKRARGRPKGAVGEKAIVQMIACELHEVRENGEATRVTTYELLLKSMRHLAMSTDLRAAKWLSEYRRLKIPEDRSGGFLVVPETMPVSQFVEQMTLRNQFATNPELREDPYFASPQDQSTPD